MKKLYTKSDPVAEEQSEGTLLELLQLACSELFPQIRSASPGRCAISIVRLLMGLLSKRLY